MVGLLDTESLLDSISSFDSEGKDWFCVTKLLLSVFCVLLFSELFIGINEIPTTNKTTIKTIDMILLSLSTCRSLEIKETGITNKPLKTIKMTPTKPKPPLNNAPSEVSAKMPTKIQRIIVTIFSLTIFSNHVLYDYITTVLKSKVAQYKFPLITNNNITIWL